MRAYELSSALSLCILHASDTCPLWRCSEMIKMNINTAVNIVIITAHDTCWANRDKSFLLRVSKLTRDIDIAIMSVCLSVCSSVCLSITFRCSVETAVLRPSLVTLCSHQSGRRAVELYHASRLWYPSFYTSSMASSALQH